MPQYHPKPVCQLDENGLYLGLTQADPDPLGGGWLLPARCIEAEPPQLSDGRCARWNGAGWDILPDHRGRTAYRTDTGQPETITAAGVLSDGLTLVPPPSARHTWQNGAWTLTPEAQAEILEEARAAKLTQAARAAQAFIDTAAGLAEVPEFEIQTWSIQAAEAAAWEAGRTAATPVLDAIAAARGIGREALIKKAAKKAKAYTLLTAHTAGERQRIEAQIRAAEDMAALAAVEIRYTLPEAV